MGPHSFSWVPEPPAAFRKERKSLLLTFCKLWGRDPSCFLGSQAHTGVDRARSMGLSVCSLFRCLQLHLGSYGSLIFMAIMRLKELSAGLSTAWLWPGRIGENWLLAVIKRLEIATACLTSPGQTLSSSAVALAFPGSFLWA